jgi:hypothetical protein
MTTTVYATSEKALLNGNYSVLKQGPKKSTFTVFKDGNETTTDVAKDFAPSKLLKVKLTVEEFKAVKAKAKDAAKAKALKAKAKKPAKK